MATKKTPAKPPAKPAVWKVAGGTPSKPELVPAETVPQDGALREFAGLVVWSPLCENCWQHYLLHDDSGSCAQMFFPFAGMRWQPMRWF